MGGGKGNSKTENTVRHAPYLEAIHRAWYNEIHDIVIGVGDSAPSYTDLDFSSMFGGSLALSAYPSLYDMYGKFMAGLDVEVLFNEVFEDTINGTVVNNAISAHASKLEDDLVESAYPRLETGLRDINAVQSSNFLVARELLEANRQREITRFTMDLKVKLLPVVAERWKSHLSWNKGIIDTYMDVIKLTVMTIMDTETQNFDTNTKINLWPLNGLDKVTVTVGAMGGATSTTNEVAGASRAQKMLGGALSGAASGMMITGGNPIGAVVGGLVGLAAGLF